MSLRVHYFFLKDNCIHCDGEDAPICRTTVVDGELKGIAVMCEPCGLKERDFAIDRGFYEFPTETTWFQMHNKEDKN
jgi:transcription elongation factor Elf1